MIKSGKLVLTDNQKQDIKLATFLLYLVMFVSAILPLSLVRALRWQIEPTSMLIQEWFEFELTFSVKSIPLYLIMATTTFAIGSLVCLMLNLSILYYITTFICTHALTPTKIYWKNGGIDQCELSTKGFGKLSDFELIQMFRTLQVFNLVQNSFFRSVFIAFHHVGCLGIIVVLFVFAVRYNEVLLDEGFVACVLVLGSIWSVITIIYFQTKMAGAVVNASREFKLAQRKITPRKLGLRKFAISCNTLYVDLTYPFYKIHQKTFVQFMERAQDYSMQLLLYCRRTT